MRLTGNFFIHFTAGLSFTELAQRFSELMIERHDAQDFLTVLVPVIFPRQMYCFLYQEITLVWFIWSSDWSVITKDISTNEISNALFRARIQGAAMRKFLGNVTYCFILRISYRMMRVWLSHSPMVAICSCWQQRGSSSWIPKGWPGKKFNTSLFLTAASEVSASVPPAVTTATASSS